MIGAADHLSGDMSQAKGNGAMAAAILQCADHAVLGAIEHNRSIEKPTSH
jgi:hypothetical protein